MRLHLVTAIILDSIASYHAFADGNKRAALLIVLMTYRLNNIDLEFTLVANRKLEQLVLEVADNKNTLSIQQLRSKLKLIIDTVT